MVQIEHKGTVKLLIIKHLRKINTTFLYLYSGKSSLFIIFSKKQTTFHPIPKPYSSSSANSALSTFKISSTVSSYKSVLLNNSLRLNLSTLLAESHPIFFRVSTTHVSNSSLN